MLLALAGQLRLNLAVERFEEGLTVGLAVGRVESTGDEVDVGLFGYSL